MCPDWELNQPPFGSQSMLNPLSYTSQGWICSFDRCCQIALCRGRINVYTLLPYKKVSVSPFLYYHSAFSEKLLSQCRFNLHFCYYEWDCTSFHVFKNLRIIQLFFCGPFVHNLGSLFCWGCWGCVYVWFCMYFISWPKTYMGLFRPSCRQLQRLHVAGLTTLAAHCTLWGSFSQGLAWAAGHCPKHTCTSRPDPYGEVSF